MPPAAQRENIGNMRSSLGRAPALEPVVAGSIPVATSRTLRSSARGMGAQRARLNTRNGHTATEKGNANPPFIWPLLETGGDELPEGSLSGWRLLTGGT